MQIEVPISAKGERLDTFLAKEFKEFSRSFFVKLIKMGHIEVISGKSRPSYVLAGQEKVLINFKESMEPEMSAVPMDLHIVFSDEHIAVINKPKGLVVHPGAGVKENTLCHGLLYHFPNMFVGYKSRPGLVHRLDRDTSGLMVIAKTHSAQVILAQAFSDRKVKKIYLAICHGEIAQDSLELITGHVRHPHNPIRFFTNLPAPKSGENPNVRLAHTNFKLLKRFSGFSLVEAHLHTGRTHQIRAHLADIGHPLVGDRLYGGKRHLGKDLPKDLKELLDSICGQALHAHELEFYHPITNEKMAFKIDAPWDFSRLK